MVTFRPGAVLHFLEEVRDELRNTPLASMLAVLEIAYRHLMPLARLLLAYLSAFKLPFNREQSRIWWPLCHFLQYRRQ